MSRLSQSALSPEDFRDFGIDLEELHITYGGLQTIKNNAFRHVHGLRQLQFSDNIISSIENNAFADVSKKKFYCNKFIIVDWRFVSITEIITRFIFLYAKSSK